MPFRKSTPTLRPNSGPTVSLNVFVSKSTHSILVLEANRNKQSLGQTIDAWAAKRAVIKGAHKLGHYPKD